MNIIYTFTERFELDISDQSARIKLSGIYKRAYAAFCNIQPERFLLSRLETAIPSISIYRQSAARSKSARVYINELR